MSTFTDVLNPTDGVTSLREAIIEANADPGEEYEIQLQAGIYSLTIGGAAEDAALTGDLDIQNPTGITIIGAGAGSTTISAAGLGDRAFHVHSGASLSIENLTLTCGTATGVFPTTSGGGFYVTGGTLTVTGSSITGNTASTGGGIYNENSGSVTITNSTLSQNSALNADGGGIYNTGSGSSITLTNSSVSQNAAHGSGGEISNFVGTLTLIRPQAAAGFTTV